MNLFLKNPITRLTVFSINLTFIYYCASSEPMTAFERKSIFLNKTPSSGEYCGMCSGDLTAIRECEIVNCWQYC